MQFKSIIKMDFFRLYRNKVSKIIFLMPIVGVIFCLQLIKLNSNGFLAYLKLTGFILAFTVAPIMFAATILSTKEEEIFRTININLGINILSKLLNLVPMILYCLIITITPYYILGGKNGVNNSTITYYIKYILVYYLVYIFVYSSIGYFLGSLLGNVLKGALSFIIGVTFIFVSAGFGSAPSLRVTLANINQYTETSILRFDAYTKAIFQSFFYVSIILLFIFCIVSSIRQRKNRGLILVVPIILFVFFAGMSFKQLQEKKSTRIVSYGELLIHTKEENGRTREKTLERSKEVTTVVNSIGDEGFIINKYKMDINLEENFKNKCERNVTLTDSNKDELQFQFYGKNKISQMKVNGQDVDYNQDSSTLYVDLKSLDLNGNKELNIIVEYSVYIYTYIDVIGAQYVSNEGAFLDENLAWYPMIASSVNKEFDILINTDNENLFANLNVDKTLNGYRLYGQSPAIILLSGDKSIISRTKDGIEYYGLDLNINDDRILKSYERFFSSWNESQKNADYAAIKYNFKVYDTSLIKKVFITGTLGTIDVQQLGDTICL